MYQDSQKCRRINIVSKKIFNKYLRKTKACVWIRHKCKKKLMGRGRTEAPS